MKILVLNAGSSSQKIRLYAIGEEATPALTPLTPLWAADADWGSPSEKMTVTLSAGEKKATTEEPISERTHWRATWMTSGLGLECLASVAEISC